MAEEGGAGGEGGAGDGTPPAPPDFMSLVPTEFHSAVTKAGIADLPSLVSNWDASQRELGGRIRIPGPDAGAEQVAAFRSKVMAALPDVLVMPAEGDTEGRKAYLGKLGVPDAPAGYEFAKFEGLAEEHVTGLDEWIRGIAHTAELPASAAAKVRDAWLGTIKAAQDAAAEQAQACVEALRKDWGGGYDARMQNAKAFVLQFASTPEEREQIEAEINAAGLGNLPAFARAMEKASRHLGEDVVLPGGAPAGLPSTAQELQSQIDEIMHNPAHAYHDSKHPDHKNAVQKMRSLFERKTALTVTAA